MRKVLLSLVFGGTLCGLAIAGSQSVYSMAFSKHVCADGWGACVVDGSTQAVDGVSDAKGYFHPSDMRLSFFSLEALPQMSPFVDLHSYEARPVAVAEVVAPEPKPVVRSQPVQKPVREPADEVVRPPPEPEQKAPEPVPEPEAVEPPPEPPPKVEEPKVEEPPEPPPEAPKLATGCSEIVELEGPAVVGQLTADQKDCLDRRINSGESLTSKRNVSLLLINNAWNSKNYSECGTYVERHLERIDRSDPDLCMKYSIHLSKKGVGKAAKVIKWSDTALQNKQSWSGNTYKRRVYGLYQLKTKAANDLWQSAERKVIEDGSEKNRSDANTWRGKTRNFAREWLDYARASGQPVKAPTTMCVSAAEGDLNFCK